MNSNIIGNNTTDDANNSTTIADRRILNNNQQLDEHHTQLDEADGRNMFRRSIGILIRRGGCSFHTKAVNALALNSILQSESSSSSSNPKIEYMIIINTDNVLFPMSKNEDDEDVDLTIISLGYSSGINLLNSMKLQALENGNASSIYLDSTAFLPLDSSERREDHDWFFPIRIDGNSPRTTSRGRLFMIFIFMALLFPFARVLLYCCVYYYDFRWRRNGQGRITGVTWSVLGDDEVRRFPNPFTQTVKVTLTEEEVKALPMVEYGVDDVNDVVQKYHSGRAELGLGLSEKMVDDIVGDEARRGEASHDAGSRNKTDSGFVQAAYDSCVSCSICICEFEEGEKLRLLPECGHVFHTECIMPWLTEKKSVCPMCLRKVQGAGCLDNDNHRRDNNNDEEHDVTSSENVLSNGNGDGRGAVSLHSGSVPHVQQSPV